MRLSPLASDSSPKGLGTPSTETLDKMSNSCLRQPHPQDDPDDESGGTRRFWDLEVEHWLETSLPRQLSWELLDYSPHDPQPRRGTFADKTTMQLTVTRVRQETGRIKSFRLAVSEGSVLPTFAPGANLPVRIRHADGKRAQRHYSILSRRVQKNRTSTFKPLPGSRN